MYFYRQSMSNQIKVFILGLIVVLISLTVWPYSHAQAAPNDIEVTIFAAPNLVVDSNVLSPSSVAPEVATIAARFCNTSGSPLSSVTAYIGDYNPGTPANSTPGIYPPKTNVTIGGTTYNGTYRFTHLGGAADGIRLIGPIGVGECRFQYWSFSYPKTANGGTIPTWGNSVSPVDDLFLDFEVWAADGNSLCPSTGSSCYASHTMYMRNEISAMANKIEPNGNPPGQWFNTNSQVVQVGDTITTNGILYRIGNVNQGFDNNGDSVPDYNVWLQPFGNPTFDPTCFRLIETSGVLTVTRSAGPDLIIPFNHSLNVQNDDPLLYFTDLPSDNTNVIGEVYYTFMALGGPCSIPISPYQEAASGSDNEKFNGDYGSGGPGTVESYSPNFDLDKNGPVSAVEGGPSFTYNIPFQNTGSSDMGLSLSSGVGGNFMISDTIPTGLQFAGNVNVTFSGGNSGTYSPIIYYSTNSGLTWSTTAPAIGTTSTAPNNLVMIQWWLDEPLEAGDGGTASFSAQVPSGYLSGGGAPFIENCADARLGGGASFSEACTVTMVQGSGSIGDLVWADDGAGVTNNGQQDGGEAGINNITVSLYWDKNGNGILDSNDVLITTQDTAFINATSNYNFTQLPPSNYIVTVDTVDADLPTGYGPTTPTFRAVTLAAAQIYTTADFGFGPVLSINKTLTTQNPAYVGETVKYRIDLFNDLPGDGTAQGFCTYNLWATVQPPVDGQPASGTGNSAWQNLPGGVLNEPDGMFAYTILSNNADQVGMSGFNIFGQTGTITSVRMVAHVRELKNLQADVNENLQLIVFRNNLAVETFTYNGVTYFTGPTGTDYVINQALTAPAGGWQWSHFQNNFSELQAIGTGTGSPASRGDLGLDAIAYVITTDQQCGGAASTITELPLTDTYDPTYLQFVSADPPASSQTSGTITWNNLGPLYAGGSKTVVVTFRALATVASTLNTAASSNGKFGTGRTVNTVMDSAPVTINAPGSIGGTIWAESNTTNAWSGTTGYDGSDTLIPGVTIQLYGCYGLVNGVSQLLTPATAPATNRECTNSAVGGTWVLLATQQTATNGSYLFSGLRPGYYNVIVAENTLPPGMTTRTARSNINTTSGDGTGFACGVCTQGTPGTSWPWFATTLNLNAFNDIVSGENRTAVSFGFRDPDNQGAITGYVWNDRNSNGVWNTATEEPIASVNVYLCTTTPCNSSTPGAVLAVTDSNGRYTYGNLNPGTYYVGVTPPPGMTQSGDPDVPGTNCGGSCNNQTNAITVVARQVSGPYNFGYTGGLTIGDTIYADWNGNGSQDSGEEGISGVQVRLYRDLNGNGTIDTGDTLLDTQTTNASGFYQFTNLAGNGAQYLVKVTTSTIPSGYTQTADPDEGGVCTVCDSKQVVTLNTTSVNTADFGYRPTGFGSIGDYVWYDTDADGLQDIGESGINGVTINLYQDQNGNGLIDAADALVATTTTAGGGAYNFTGLYAYTYIVEIAQSNFGGALADLTMTTNGAPYTNTSAQVSYAVNLSSGEDFDDADFGFAEGIIGDYIWRDDNGNGTPDPGEPGIDGVTVTLYNDNDGNGVVSAGDTIVDTQITAGGGLYEFGGLPAGNYVVAVTPPVGYALTGDPDAYTTNSGASPYPPCSTTDPNYLFCDNQYGVSLYAGQVDRSADFGYQPSAYLGDTLWIDSDNDGIRDAGESGIPYITVWLCSTTPCNASTAVMTTTTDTAGYYAFGNIPNGSYTLGVNTSDPDFPVGLTNTYDPDGTTDSNTNVTVAGNVTTVVGNCTDVNGACSLTGDFGYQFIGIQTISGTVFFDAGNDGGLYNSGTDSTYDGVPVYLWRCIGPCGGGDDILIASTNTVGGGTYAFNNLPNGLYIVAVNTGAPQLSSLTATREPDADPCGVSCNGYTTVTLTGTGAVNQDFGFFAAIDYGDLPSNYNNTLSSDNGARHIIGSAYLGTGVTGEANGQESPTASADTDEGVARGGIWMDGANGASIVVDVVCPTPTCYLSGWVDWDYTGTGGDGDFNDNGERVLVDYPVSTGSNLITFNVPAGVFNGTGTNRSIFTRFRLYANSTSGSAQPTGSTVNGEVEDYLWQFTPTAVSFHSLTFTKSLADITMSITLIMILALLSLAMVIRQRRRLD